MGLISRIFQAADRADRRLENRFYDWENFAPPRSGWSPTASGAFVGRSNAVGLPAVAAVIRLFAESTGMTPLLVYRGDPPNLERARDAWQWTRLHDAPNDDQSAFDFWQDVETSQEAAGVTYIYKAKARPVVRDAEDIQLFVLEPSNVRVYRDQGVKKFEVRQGATTKTYTTAQILHIRGWSTSPGADEATSPITLHREALGKALATEDYESRFFVNNATIPIALKVPSNITQGQADDMRQMFMDRYSGTANAFTPAIVKNNADIVKLGISLADAQFIEQKRYGLEDVARIFRLSSLSFLGASAQERPGIVDEDIHRFLQIDLAPRLKRIEMAVRADRDIFPDPSLFPEFLPDAVLRPDIQARFAAYKDALQGGWMTGNEVRERENLPPHPDGQSLQQTPVGGAPNPPANQGEQMQMKGMT